MNRKNLIRMAPIGATTQMDRSSCHAQPTVWPASSRRSGWRAAAASFRSPPHRIRLARWRAVSSEGLKGARIGVVRANFGGRNDLRTTVGESALKVLSAAGATRRRMPALPTGIDVAEACFQGDCR